ncbi:hypothetical protein [Deinococcus misasensis]|uniref:hypothetical protein n=1 Tax=Deinococcus misasensis TaxID=392413 RepID=UPI000556FD4D|nr:hypothetical protein [Deinococcus misasensis]
MVPLLSEMVSVQGRFHRSVQLVKDWQDARHLEGYILTPNARQLTTRILQGLAHTGQPRTWSITGPYGSGKSSFALFLTDVLAFQSPRTQQGQAVKGAAGFDLPPFFPVLVVGQRKPLHITLKAALFEAATAAFPELETPLAHWEETNTKPTDLLHIVAEHAHKQGRGGVLFILDEFGKFLEHAGQHPDTVDLFVMQELAEYVSRSEIPIALITVLHSGFGDYLMQADPTARAEWQKIQGRFTDVNFQEPAEQFLRLIASAVQFQSTPEILQAYQQHVQSVLKNGVLDEARKRIPALDTLLPECLPIEPLTALILWPLFRSKLAQNERSLFAFLTGTEPYGLMDFLTTQQAEQDHLPMYGMHHLYQYVVHTLGSAAYQSDLARRWSAIEVACDRIGQQADPFLHQLVQTLGLVAHYGAQVGLKATPETLQAACGKDVQAALEELVRRSIVVYRKYDQSYVLWDGSDIDLDAEFEKVLGKMGQIQLARALEKHLELYPHVARAHYIRTGNLRSFEVKIFEGRSTELSSYISKLGHQKHQILYVLSHSEAEKKQLQMIACHHADHHNLIFAFPKAVVGLEGVLRELLAWETIRRTSTELEGDPVAKKELDGRIQLTRQRLENIIGALFGVKGYRFEPSQSVWYHAGMQQEVADARHFQQWISRILDDIYPDAPTIHNELLNRNQLSSQSAKARRNLFEAMLTRSHETRLGMEGFPPEYSMYAAILRKGGFHQEKDGVWFFTHPTGSYQKMWQAMLDFLGQHKEQRTPLTALFDLLRQAPYGIAEGPIPVFVSALLIHLRNSIAIFDEGLFVPELRIEVLERMMRRPDLFEIQQLEFSGEALEALQEMQEAIRIYANKDDGQDLPALMDVVKPLILVAAKLPAYSRFTRKLDPPSAVLLRDMLLRIKDPVKLVTHDLLNLYRDAVSQDENPPSLSGWLLACLNAMGSAYSGVLYQIEEQVREAFNLSAPFAELAENLRQRAIPLKNYTADAALTALVQQLSNLVSNAQQWREQLGRIVNLGKPVTDWRDGDVVAFGVKLGQLASDFARLEELVLEKNHAVHEETAVQVIRIGVLGQDFKEDRKVFSLRADQKTEAEQLSEKLLSQFRSGTQAMDPNVVLSALALLTQKVIGGQHD